MTGPALYSDSGRQQKCSQSSSSLIIPGITSAQLLPPVETSACFDFFMCASQINDRSARGENRRANVIPGEDLPLKQLDACSALRKQGCGDCPCRAAANN